MNTLSTIQIPPELPFLMFLCWQLKTTRTFNPEEILSRYERGWKYRTLFEIPQDELTFLRTLAQRYHSWLITEL